MIIGRSTATFVTISRRSSVRWDHYDNDTSFLAKSRPDPDRDGSAARSGAGGGEACSTHGRAAGYSPTDPLIEYLQRNVSGVVDIERLNLDSGRAPCAAGFACPCRWSARARLWADQPGQRRSDQDYSSDDRRLLGNLATQAAPACAWPNWCGNSSWRRWKRQRIEQELRVARLIQQTLLPMMCPTSPGGK